MARGWESKAVEAQQDARDTSAPSTGPVLSAAETVDAQQVASLRLARTRVLSELQRACQPAHRAMLEAALADLDQKLGAASPRS